MNRSLKKETALVSGFRYSPPKMKISFLLDGEAAIVLDALGLGGGEGSSVTVRNLVCSAA